MKKLIFDIIAVMLLAVIVHITRKFENKKLSKIIIVFYLAICAFVNLRAFIGAIVPEFGHKWGDWIVETEPTCETAGVEVRICKNDSSHQERRELPALGHDWQPATDSQPETCARCGKQQGLTLQTIPDPSDILLQTPGASITPTPTDIIQQPENLEVYPSDTARFTVVASKAVKSYMWQYCKDGVTWKNVTVSEFPSAVTDTLVFKAHNAHNGFQYRCIVHFEDGTTEVSEPAKITVKSY